MALSLGSSRLGQRKQRHSPTTALAKAPPGSASTPSSIEESRCLELLFPTFWSTFQPSQRCYLNQIEKIVIALTQPFIAVPVTLPSKSLKKCLYTSTVLKLRSSKSYVVLKRFRIVNVARFAREVVKYNFLKVIFDIEEWKSTSALMHIQHLFLLKGNLVSQGSWSHVMTIALYGPWTFSVLYYYESPTSIYSSTAAGAHHKRGRERVSERGGTSIPRPNVKGLFTLLCNDDCSHQAHWTIIAAVLLLLCWPHINPPTHVMM